MAAWLRLAGVTRNNLDNVEVAFPIGLMTAVTGISGSGKSSLVSQALVELVDASLGREAARDEPEVSGPDEAAVRRLIADFADSWNRHDMAAMHALDTPDVEWVNVVGNDWVGVDNVRKGHANFHRVLAADMSALPPEKELVYQPPPSIAEHI